MALDKLANRYAKAIFEYLKDAAKIRSVIAEIRAFAETVQKNSELGYVLTTELFSEGERRAVTEDVANKMGLSSEAKRILIVLAEASRVGHAQAIAEKLELLVLESNDVIPLRVESSNELTAEERKKIEVRFHDLLGKKVEANYVTDPELMGGLRVTAAGRTYDGSLAGWINSIEEQLSRAF